VSAAGRVGSGARRVALGLLFWAGTAGAADAPALLFKGARVFDGGKVQQADVLVEGGVIKQVGPGLSAPGAQVVQGRGKTLLPGFIDAHTHALGPHPLETALVFGVTTELEMFGSPAQNRERREREKRGDPTGGADLRSAGILATAPGGHGTEYGVPIPTLSKPAEATSFVAARLAEGSDYIKIVFDDMAWTGADAIPTLDLATVKAVIDAAHARKTLAVVHIGTQAAARAVIEAGADAVVHVFADSAPAADFAATLARKHAFVVPTLAVLSGLCAGGDNARLAQDRALRPYLEPNDAAALASHFPTRLPAASCGHAAAAVKQLATAGVPILAGTDAPNPGTAHGVSLHHELALLVAAGLTPLQALTAATAAPAARFGLDDRGRIAPGLRADLVLVDGDPTTDIRRTRAIAGVWKRGVPCDRAAARQRVVEAEHQIAVQKAAPAPRGSQPGIIATFDDGTLSARYGAGWAPSTDSLRGGTSTVDPRVIPGGARGSKHALAVAGEIRGTTPSPWAGVMFSPGMAPMAPANLSAHRTLSFFVRGDGGTYRVMLFARHLGFRPAILPFTAAPQWQKVTFPLTAFDALDGRDLTGIVWTAGPRPGKFSFQLDEIELR
jgi:imidazolonepropionase-like amidohydrolase